MKFLKTPLHLTQVEKIVGFSFLAVILVLNVVIVSSLQSEQTLNTEAATKTTSLGFFGNVGTFAQTTDPCGYSNLAAFSSTGAGGTGAGGNGTGGNGTGGNGTGGNGTGGNGTGGNGTGGNGTGGNGTGGNGTGGNGTGGNGTGGNGTGGNGTGGNGTGGNGTGGNGTGGNGTGGNGTGGNGTGGNGTGGNGTGGNGTGGNGTGGNGTGGNGTGGNGTGGNGTGGNGTGGNGTGGNGTGGNGTGGNGTGGNGTGGNGTGGNGTGGNGTGGNGTGGNGTGVSIANANIQGCVDPIGFINANDLLNYVLGDSDAGKKTRSANVNSDTMQTGAKYATTTEPLFLSVLTSAYTDEFSAYAAGLNYAMNPKTESVEQVAANLAYGSTVENAPEAQVFAEVASCFKTGCWAGKNGHNGNYDDAELAKLVKSWGFTAIASEPRVGQDDVNTIGAVVQALNETPSAVTRLQELDEIYTANAGNGTTTKNAVEDLKDYKESMAFVISGAYAQELQDYSTGVEITKAVPFNIQAAQQGYSFNCVGGVACPTVAPAAGSNDTVGNIGAGGTGAGGNGTGGNGTGGNGTGGNGTGGNGTGGNGTGGNGTGGNGTGGNGTGGNGTGGNGTGGNGTGGTGNGSGGSSNSSISDLISQLIALLQKLFGM